MRIIAQFKKAGTARHISHLDLQRAMQRALRRSNLPIKYSMGFSPHPLLSFASALSLGFTSVAEIMDISMAALVSAEEFEQKLAPQLPPSLALVSAHAVEDDYPGLMALVQSADYEVCAQLDGSIPEGVLHERMAAVLSAPIMAGKKTKAGIKEINLQEQVLAFELREHKDGAAQFFVRCDCSPTGALNPKLLFDAIREKLGILDEPDYHRLALWADKTGNTPLWGRKEQP